MPESYEKLSLGQKLSFCKGVFNDYKRMEDSIVALNKTAAKDLKACNATAYKAKKEVDDCQKQKDFLIPAFCNVSQEYEYTLGDKATVTGKKEPLPNLQLVKKNCPEFQPAKVEMLDAETIKQLRSELFKDNSNEEASMFSEGVGEPEDFPSAQEEGPEDDEETSGPGNSHDSSANYDIIGEHDQS